MSALRLGRGTPAITGDRWSILAELCGSDVESLLDIGCRDQQLRNHLPRATRYVGLDISPPADVVASAEDPLPFDDDAFECAVMADVLEHLANPHGALTEALRVASHRAVVMLPNLYTLILRAAFVLGRTGAKYEFGPVNPMDRHRWVMNFSQGAAFTHGIAQECGWRVHHEYGWDREFRRLSVRSAYGLARRVATPNLWAYGYAAVLGR